MLIWNYYLPFNNVFNFILKRFLTNFHISLIDSPISNDRDAGFCSASSESEGGDDLMADSPLCASPNDVEIGEYGSIEVKSTVIVRHKRKSMEPSKVVESVPMSANYSSFSEARSNMAVSGPLKKRIRYTSSADSAVILTPPSLPSSPPMSDNRFSILENAWDSTEVIARENMPDPAHIFVRHPGVTTFHRAFTLTSQPEQKEPLALVTRIPQSRDVEKCAERFHMKQKSRKTYSEHIKHNKETCDILMDQTEDETGRNTGSQSRPQQRNYKNMTRERRIEANARERTRVHTISAAYETLRRAVPAYASSQKLSKLSVLRVACSYILTLSRMAGQDYSSDESEPTIADCIEAISSTIQTEGKSKRKKDE